MNKSKIVKLSGFCDATFYVGWNNDEPVDGFIVQIDGKNYGCHVDPDDGYRSYGSFFETEQECTNTFPPQEVLYVSFDEEGDSDMNEEPKRRGISLKNIETKEVILDVSTVWYDSYYPVGHCSWHPENMPCNQEENKYEDATITIVAEWYRKCGDHVIIGRTKDGEYIEVIITKDGLMFGPITGFEIFNPKSN